MEGWVDGWMDGQTDRQIYYLFIFYLYIRNLNRFLDNRIMKFLCLSEQQKMMIGNEIKGMFYPARSR
jgi:hypothetical protein